jgi:hypothetical protein
MSSWVALNVEPDEAVEEEVDDTKELQICTPFEIGDRLWVFEDLGIEKSFIGLCSLGVVLWHVELTPCRAGSH